MSIAQNTEASQEGVTAANPKYRVARGSRISKGHLLYAAYQAKDGEVVTGEALVPLRSGRQWIVECEAVRIRGQVFGIFHLEPVPVKSRHQLPLFYQGVTPPTLPVHLDEEPTDALQWKIRK